jgi:hypothetical protein
LQRVYHNGGVAGVPLERPDRGLGINVLRHRVAQIKMEYVSGQNVFSGARSLSDRHPSPDFAIFVLIVLCPAEISAWLALLPIYQKKGRLLARARVRRWGKPRDRLTTLQVQ